MKNWELIVDTILEVKNLSKRFGGLQVIDHLNLKFRSQELRCIIGPNGAGKTTLFNLITARIKPDEGQVIFEDKDITDLRPHDISRRGIARKFQVPTVFDELTVMDNLVIAARGRQSMGALLFSEVENGLYDRVNEVMGITHLEGKGDELVGNLSHGEKQWLEIGMVLAYQPRIMLLDEPTAGMSPQETLETARIIGMISQNTTTVVIEHDIKFLKEIGEHVTVMHQGGILAEGTFAEIESDSTVRDVYLGKR
jgi:urea ABC transporter ATP-binding protein UrtD